MGTREEQIRGKCQQIADMLSFKNKAYGDSALNPLRVFSKGQSPEESLRLRMDDKLSRLMRGDGSGDEDAVLDLVGYGILLLIARDERLAAAPIVDAFSHPDEKARVVDFLQSDDVTAARNALTERIVTVRPNRTMTCRRCKHQRVDAPMTDAQFFQKNRDYGWHVYDEHSGLCVDCLHQGAGIEQFATVASPEEAMAAFERDASEAAK